jgi:hypothetical protein
MAQQPPTSRDDEDPTIEEEAPVFDGSHTDQLDETYRFRVVTASESEHGSVGFDDRGNPQWKWRAELAPIGSDPGATFDELKALENPALTLEDEAKPPSPATVGYDPYATGAFPKPKVRR